jgi:hypothetical protein
MLNVHLGPVQQKRLAFDAERIQSRIACLVDVMHFSLM